MAKKVAYYGNLLALALILSYLERLIPFDFGVPGIKLGLTNIIPLFLLYRNGFKSAMLLNISRIFLAGLLFGNFLSLTYALAGGILSTAVMWLMKKTSKFGVAGVSVAGGISHNFGQLTAAAAVLQTPALFYYLPVLAAAGVLAGFLVGVTARLVLNALCHAKI